VTVEQRLAEYQTVVVVLEALLDGVVLYLVVQVHVTPINQLVTVDTIALVNPQPNQLSHVMTAIRRRK